MRLIKGRAREEEREREKEKGGERVHGGRERINRRRN